jgi:spore maturation protein CgeB
VIDSTKPRVAIYYDVLASTGYRDDGCPLYINWNLRKLLNGDTQVEDHNRNVVHLSPCNPTHDFGTFDLHILVDYGEDALGLPLDWKLPSPNAYWVSDAHLGYEYRLERAKQFDHVFVAQKSFIERFVKDGIDRDKIHYLPHAFEPDAYKPLSIIDKWDWCFVGYPNSVHRIELLDRFIKEFPNYYLGWRLAGVQGYNEIHDVNEKYNMSKIVINDAVNQDLNMRVFETLGAGRLLITQDIPELRENFTHGKHLLTYGSIDYAVIEARGILKDNEKMAAIAKAGHDEVMEKHTYMHRTKEILKTCIQYEPKGEPLCL